MPHFPGSKGASMCTLFRWTASAIAFLSFLALIPPVRAAEGDAHIFTGNPSGARADEAKPDNYLVKKRQYALSYNNSTGTANWVSWQLSKAWLGRGHRDNPFAPDTSLPVEYFRARPRDYDRSGFDRGHLCPAADRSVSHKDMDATFLMTNMLPQAPDLASTVANGTGNWTTSAAGVPGRARRSHRRTTDPWQKGRSTAPLRVIDR